MYFTMGNFADILRNRLSSMSNDEFDQWWGKIEAQRTDKNTISAAEYQNIMDNYIGGNMIMEIADLAEDRVSIAVEKCELEFSEEDYNLAA